MFLQILIWVAVVIVFAGLLILFIWLYRNEPSGIKLILIGVFALGTLGGVIGGISTTVSFSKRVYVNSINTYLSTLKTYRPEINTGDEMAYGSDVKDGHIKITLFGIEDTSYTGDEYFKIVYTKASESSSYYIKYSTTVKNSDLGLKSQKELFADNSYEITYSTYYSLDEARELALKDGGAAVEALAENLIRIGHNSYYTKKSPQMWDGRFEVRDFGLFSNFDSTLLKSLFGEYNK